MVAQLEHINQTDAPAQTSVGAVGNAHLEAQKGYESGFSSVKAAMTPNYDTGLTNVTLFDSGAASAREKPKTAAALEAVAANAPEAPVQTAAVVGPGATSTEKAPAEKEKPGVITPKDDSDKMPVLPGVPEQNDWPMDEHGNHPGEPTDGPNPDLPGDQAQTVAGADGRPKTITTTEVYKDGNINTTFGFDDKGNITRAIESKDGTDVAQFDANGKPTSHTVTPPGSSTPQDASVNPDDKVTVQRDANGKPTSIVSEDGDVTTKLTLNENGQVTERTIGKPDQDDTTRFDEDGNAVYDRTTSLDKEGNKTKTSTITPDATTDETFDKDGKVSKTEVWSGQGDYHTTTERLADGTLLSSLETGGTSQTILTRPDGTRIEYNRDDNQDASKKEITYPDGSKSGVTETHDNTTNYKVDPDGFWDAITVTKQGGVATKYSGAPGQHDMDTYFQGTPSTPI